MKGSKLILATLAVPILALTVVSRAPVNAGTSPVDPVSTYKAKCAACHGAKAEKHFNSSKPDGQLVNAVVNGVKPKMPAYGKSLGADTCKALVAHMKSLK
jgi:cytochrome c5